MISSVLYKVPEEVFHRSQIWKLRGPGNQPPDLPIQQSGNSLTRKARIHGRNEVVLHSTETRCKAMFSIIARKGLPVTIGSSKKKGLITLFFIKIHYACSCSLLS
jgi:hypothetical protein